jgi:hypothetical protein
MTADKERSKSKTMGRNGQRNYPSAWHTGLPSQAGTEIVIKNGHFLGLTAVFKGEKHGHFQSHSKSFSEETNLH